MSRVSWRFILMKGQQFWRAFTSIQSVPRFAKLDSTEAMTFSAELSPGLDGYWTLVAKVSPLSFHPASRVKASCFLPTYVGAVSTSL